MANLSKTSISWAIRHLCRHFDTDIFPELFEFKAIHDSIDALAGDLSKQDICQWQSRTFRRCLVPKHKYGFRIATQLDPLDSIFYLALLYEVGEDLEKFRLPKSRRTSFSYRFKPNNSDYLMFDASHSYPEFDEHTRALAKKYPIVLITDISDFYHRIYLHRLDNSLSKALSNKPTYRKAIINLIKGWNQNVSYGIPVGNNPSRLLAEIVIDDVDRSLSAEGIVFTRWVDDFRIFAKSREHAFRHLVKLATILYETHGLTLQANKTKILSSEDFVGEVLDTEERRAIDSLAENFDAIVDSLGLVNPYGPIEYDDLSPSLQKQIDSMNLGSLLDQEIDAEDLDIPKTKFLINRLGQLQELSPLRKLMSRLDRLYPVLPEIIRYLTNVSTSLDVSVRARIGAAFLDKLNNSLTGQLEFHRMHILSLFAESDKWGNVDRLTSLYDHHSDSWYRRTLLLALAKANQDYWLRAKKSSMEQMPEWERRAFIYAASCLPEDERVNYYKAISRRADPLEKLLVEWVRTHPIS